MPVVMAVGKCMKLYVFRRLQARRALLLNFLYLVKNRTKLTAKGCLNQCTYCMNSVTKSNVVEIINLNNGYETHSGRPQNLRSLATLGPL